MTAEEFQRMVYQSRRSDFSFDDWLSYSPGHFADEFLPYVRTLDAQAARMHDGAGLFKDSERTQQRLYQLTDSEHPINLVACIYPKEVAAESYKNRVVVGSNEVCTFIEVAQDDTIEVSFKLGNNFKEFLFSYSKQNKTTINPAVVENTTYKTNINYLKAIFNRRVAHYYLMKFVLKIIGIDEEKKFQKEKRMEEETIYDQTKGTDILRVNEEGTALMQVKHEFVNVGESIAQVKYNTSATVTTRGTVIVSQFKQEISSRGEDVFYYKNSLGTFEGTLQDAQNAFPDVDFSDVKIPPQNTQKKNPEFDNLGISWDSSKPLEWRTINEYDAEQNGGKPATWDKWKIDTDKALDAFQTALDVAGLVPGAGEVADCLNGLISLARGNYADAALSFAAMIPVIGGAATGIKQARKVKKVEGVYDLVVKNAGDVKGYIGKSNDTAKHITGHFNPKRRKLLNKVNPVGGRFDLKTPEGLKKFYKEAEEIARKYDLPTKFDPPNF